MDRKPSSSRNMGLMHTILFVCCMLIKEVILYEDCTSNPSADIAKCCSLCPPGQGEVTKCTNETDTQCRPCENGRTFSSPKYDTKTCMKCKTCAVLEREISACNATHDTVCGCPGDYYFDEMVEQCKQCDSCPYGSGAVVPCSTQSNSVCRKCENGTFSGRNSPTRPCTPCKVCGPSEIHIMACTDQQDTMCIDKPKATDQPLGKKIREKDFDAIPVYCAALGAVVVGLLAYVIFKQYSRIRDKKRHKIHDPHEHVEYSRASGINDSGVFVESATYNELTKYKDLPLSKRKCVEHLLASHRGNPGDWRALAHQLGYTHEQINQLASHGDSAHCCQMVLRTWAHSKRKTTLGTLLKALGHIGRYDIVNILQADLKSTETDLRHVQMV
ncbi:tumor necrosis factor receptor superfamily member 16-like [Crassostrea virginica]